MKQPSSQGGGQAERGHRYTIFGFSLWSEFPLPELVTSTETSDPDVRIVRAKIERGVGGQNDRIITSEHVVLQMPGVATYEIRDGTTILVDSDSGASARNVRLYLLGSALAAIMHQRGLFPLHANAIQIADKAVAFLGAPSAGKSTLATWFYDRGHNVLSDDVCVVGFDANSLPIADVGIPRLRLWRDALEATGRSTGDHEQSFDEVQKYTVRMTHSASRRAVPLSHLYVIRRDEDEVSTTAITRLGGSAAVQALAENTYRGAYIRSMGGAKRHLEQCVRLARAIVIFEVRRPWGLDALEQVGIALETHARSFMAASYLLEADETLVR